MNYHHLSVRVIFKSNQKMYYRFSSDVKTVTTVHNIDCALGTWQREADNRNVIFPFMKVSTKCASADILRSKQYVSRSIIVFFTREPTIHSHVDRTIGSSIREDRINV